MVKVAVLVNFSRKIQLKINLKIKLRKVNYAKVDFQA